MSTELEALQGDAEEQAILQLSDVEVLDPDCAHARADEILLEFIIAAGFADIADAYEQLLNKARWW